MKLQRIRGAMKPFKLRMLFHDTEKLSLILEIIWHQGRTEQKATLETRFKTCHRLRIFDKK